MVAGFCGVAQRQSMDASLAMCAQTMVAHQMPGGVVSPWNFDLLRDGHPVLVGEGKNNVLHVAHNAQENLAHVHVFLPIDLPRIIVHPLPPLPLPTYCLVVHVNSPSLVMNVNGSGTNYDGSFQCFGSTGGGGSLHCRVEHHVRDKFATLYYMA